MPAFRFGRRRPMARCGLIIRFCCRNDLTDPPQHRGARPPAIISRHQSSCRSLRMRRHPTVEPIFARHLQASTTEDKARCLATPSAVAVTDSVRRQPSTPPHHAMLNGISLWAFHKKRYPLSETQRWVHSVAGAKAVWRREPAWSARTPGSQGLPPTDAQPSHRTSTG